MPATLRNLLLIQRGQRTLDPLLAIYYLTTHCNLNCVYCEDFGARRKEESELRLSSSTNISCRRENG